MANTNEINNLNNPASANAGSADDLIAGPGKGDVITGQPVFNPSSTNEPKAPVVETVPKSQYEDLETKLGSQGKELGEVRNFIEEITPLLNKLDKQPELVQAIIDGKIDANLAKAVLEGKVSIQDAEIVNKANEEVKKDVGQKVYDTLKPSEIEKMVADQIAKATSNISDKFTKTINETEEIRSFEKKTSDFISSTPDFAEYAEAVDKWLDLHQDIDDVSIAYSAVKGEVLSKLIEADKQKNAGEIAKAAAADLGGGSSQNASIVQDKKVIDDLIGGRTNPNIL
jgi:hypothetical protein